MLSEFSKFHTDHLMLLVGTNPLPNYVAGRLLVGANTKIHLLVDRDWVGASPDSARGRVLERLTQLLDRKLGTGRVVKPYLDVDPSNSKEIYDKVCQCVIDTTGTWALHYTGGKKIMAVYAQRGMQVSLAEHEPAWYSYLDADTLEMVVSKNPNDRPNRPLAHLQVPMTLSELLFLHGQPDYVIKLVDWEKSTSECQSDTPKRNAPRREAYKPMLEPDLYRALLDAWIDPETCQASRDMQDWRDRQLKLCDSQYVLEHIYAMLSDLKIEAAQDWVRQALIRQFGKDPLKEKSKGARKAFVLEVQSDVEMPERVKGYAGQTLRELGEQLDIGVGKLVDWLHGKWLEHYVLATVQNLEKSCSLSDYALGLESHIFREREEDVNETDTRKHFESDVIVIQGYRLFYVSITTDKSLSLCKEKLFEAYMRAQYLGGDEAEVALVCFHQDPAMVEDQIKQAHGPKAKVRVFGPKHIRNLETELRGWFLQRGNQ